MVDVSMSREVNCQDHLSSYMDHIHSVSSNSDDEPMDKLSQAVLATCLLNESKASPSGSIESHSHHGNCQHKKCHAVGDLEMQEEKRFSGSEVISKDENALNEGLTSARNRMVMMTGTIRRGQRSCDLVQVQLELSEDELNRLNKSLASDDEETQPERIWGLKKGLHIFVFTFLFIPVSFIMSLCITFYIGTVTWYNIYLYLSEERTIWHKIFICPFLILFYPVLIILASLSMAAYAACVQVSWYYKNWLREIRDYEKGFFGWLCNKLNVPECAPYQVVVLDDQDVMPE